MHILTFLLISLIALFVVYYRYTTTRYCKLKNTVKDLRDITNKLDFKILQKNDFITKQEKLIKLCTSLIDDYKHVCINGWRCLSTQKKDINDDKGVIEVIGTTNLAPDIYIVIKSFVYIKNDSNDCEFAEREAYDLIDKIQE